MSRSNTMFDIRWNVDKYRKNYDSEHWSLCKAFMETHKTKYPEHKLVLLTEAFYQMGVYGSSYDPKTTRLVNALTVEVLDPILESHPGILCHPFNKTPAIPQLPRVAKSSKEDVSHHPSSIWDVQVDKSIVANVLVEAQLKELLKGFVIIYDIRRESTMNDNKVGILEESFKRSKFGPCHWAKDDTHNNICPIRMSLKWRNVVLAEAVGIDETNLKTRLAQAVLSKLANFSSGIEAKWSYYRDGRLPDRFDNPNPKKSNIYKVMRRSQFKALAEILSYVDTFANSDSFAEVAFSLDFSNQEKKQLMEYIDKNWCTKLTYRITSKVGVKSKSELSHVFIYHIRSGEELRRWLEQSDGENDRYRMVSAGKHRRAGACDNNVREVLTTDAVQVPGEAGKQANENNPPLPTSIVQIDKEKENKSKEEEELRKKNNIAKDDKQNKDTENKDRENENNGKETGKTAEGNKTKDTDTVNKETPKKSQGPEDELEKLLNGFVLFYDANKTSEIDKDDWFTALCESFKLSKFGPLEVIIENVGPLRKSCVFIWKDRKLASAEGLTETQAKTAATLQLISKLEPFTYIIQAKEEYFCEGKVPAFIEDPEKSNTEFYRLVRRKDLPSYYSIFQTIDEFSRNLCHGELIFGSDFTWELKNEIVVYLKAKGLGHRYFTQNEQKPWTHMGVFHIVKPEELKEHLLKNGGENDKYKLIPPSKAEPLSVKTSEEKASKEPDKSSGSAAKKPAVTAVAARKQLEPAVSAAKKPAVTAVAARKQPEPAVSAAKKPAVAAVEKRKQPEPDPPPVIEDVESNKIQIKLKKFKVDKVDYPEDTGGDFPGLILWIGIRKNSVWQKNIFNILLESFKMSKYGELIIEESEESVWGRKEALKKCVIKSSRKVLAVGLGDSKTEAKNSASLQVLQQLRKHCYTIQAKESYFKEGKATPYNFNPDPTKAHVYKLMKRNNFKDRPAMIKYVNDFAKNSCSEEVIFGDDFTYDEREYILDHCRKIDLNYRLIKCQSITKNMHTHIAIFHQQPPPVIKAELMKAGGESDMYRLINPGGKITNQNNQADMWPDTFVTNEKEAPDLETEQPSVQVPAPQTCKSQSNKVQSLPQQGLVNNGASSNSKPIPSLINRVPISDSILSSNQKKTDIDNSAPATHKVNSNTTLKKQIPVPMSDLPVEGKSAVINPVASEPPKKPENKAVTDISKQHLENQQVGTKHLQNHLTGPPPLQNFTGPPPLQNMIGPPPLQNFIGPPPVQNFIGPPPLQNQPFGPQPQFGFPLETGLTQSFQEVPFGPQPLFAPPPPIYSQPFMDTPLQFGPNPPMYVQQQPPCDAGPVGMPTVIPPTEMVSQPGDVQMPSVTITVPNHPPTTDLREELAKKRQAENRKSSPDRIVYDVTTERSIDNTDENDSDGWSRKVFVAKPEVKGQTRNPVSQNIGGPKENAHDLREKLKYKEFSRETQGPAEMTPQKNSLSTNVPIKKQTVFNKQSFKAEGTDRIRRSPQFDRRRMSPDRDRNISRERIIYREPSPDQRRHREGSYERRVYHQDLEENRDHRKYRSRSPSRTVAYRDLWDNIPRFYSESIFMYKYVKQDSKTETDPYALLRATRSLSFDVDFHFIKEQTAIDEWQVSVELITDNSGIRPLVGEGMARTEQEASRRAAHHAVDTVQKACQVIEPNFRYFCEGGEPEFILRRNPRKTSVYEIIQNMDPETPLARYTVEVMFRMFLSSDLEDLFFLATDFSYLERVLVVDVATQMNLWWRLFGPRHPQARPDDVVSTQHVCVFKQKTALQLIRELLANGKSSEKYTLVDPREYRLIQPRFHRDVR